MWRCVMREYIICNYPGGLHISAAIWPCICLFSCLVITPKPSISVDQTLLQFT